MKKILLLGILLVQLMSACTSQPVAPTEGPSFHDVVTTRRSIRNYKLVPVGRDTLNMIMECGINAPNGQNKQSWEVRVVDDTAVMDQIKELMAASNPEIPAEAVKGCFRGAPVMVFIANDPAYDFSTIDCGLLSENIMLAGWSLGVGSVCLGSPVRVLRNAPEALAKLGFSEGYTPVICIGMGYPAESPDAKPRDFSKVRFIE